MGSFSLVSSDNLLFFSYFMHPSLCNVLGPTKKPLRIPKHCSETHKGLSQAVPPYTPLLATKNPLPGE